MRVRPATLDDVPAIARIHVDSWRATYRGIVPDPFLDQLSVADHAQRWQLRVQDAELITLVAETGAGNLVGFVIGGAERSGDSAFSAELYAVYLDPAHMRRGIGALLVRGLALALQDSGHRSLLVWVLADNPARYFYMALGATFVRSATITIGGVALAEEAYGWPEIARLLQHSDRTSGS